MKTNTKPATVRGVTHEGAPARNINSEQQLRRSVMSCLLWEDQFYEDGKSIADRISKGVAAVNPGTACKIAVEARSQMKLRHVPLLICREMARLPSHRHVVADTLFEVIQRPDELTEFLSIYWLDGRKPLSAQIKKGLARAFCKFDAYQLAKYNRDAKVKLRDVLFLCHAKPRDTEQQAVWQKLIDGTLESPDTWEVALSGGADKRATFERMIAEGKLGALAVLRNLRNMVDAGVPDPVIRSALQSMDTDRVLPFRFLSAAQHAPRFEPELESAMFRGLDAVEKLPGVTRILIDISGSMDYSKISAKSDLTRKDAAIALAILLREISQVVEVHAFHSHVFEVPPRRGFALRDAIKKLGSGGTDLGRAVRTLNSRARDGDRMIVVTDEQSATRVPNPVGRGYMVNVASFKNGVGYGPWRHIDGWSESIVRFIQELESSSF